MINEARQRVEDDPSKQFDSFDVEGGDYTLLAESILHAITESRPTEEDQEMVDWLTTILEAIGRGDPYCTEHDREKVPYIGGFVCPECARNDFFSFAFKNNDDEGEIKNGNR